MKLFLRPKGTLTSRYADFSAYRSFKHTGIDFDSGVYRSEAHAMRDGYIYKTKGKSSTDYQVYKNVYQIVETPIGPMEVAYVHCAKILASEGDFVTTGQIIYLEGNTGTQVYSGGKKVLPSEKPSGKGSHSHISVRPVKRVKSRRDGKHYLRDANNRHYKDKDRYYFEIVHDDPNMKGWVDWEEWIYENIDNDPIREKTIEAIKVVAKKLLNAVVIELKRRKLL